MTPPEARAAAPGQPVQAGPRVLVGTSGWTYPEWRGQFYPRGLPQRQELEHLAARVASVEVNASFYALQRPESYRSWAQRTPAGFVLAVKGERSATHRKHLVDVEADVAAFVASGVLGLEEKLGPVLWQFPPGLRFSPERLGTFLALLPRTTAAAAELAARCGHPTPVVVADRPLRHAVEVRHPSFACAEAVGLLREHGVALVVADSAGRYPVLADVTADFVYVRLHGARELYASGYEDAELDEWAARVRAWAGGGTPDGAPLLAPPDPPAPHGRDVYVYFDNTMRSRAPFDAQALARRL
ncbi:uncharacterized protein YecE (DUF72 family) [Kineococcus xinjiangensis]|uniref:Uncharacterized protein YecE (DUF72 family) n=1 Tax=Kineococcus xinjiangensis TaxID=512762 RepID=A0A2S6IPU6_9ACTN|nr:DUF72 domain-containing protein [Kineococcus xinjiangensis]PPK96160.1 uncharacterized protein YecE (DUF72 family) [Kineococcus xinjiangensis]